VKDASYGRLVFCDQAVLRPNHLPRWLFSALQQVLLLLLSDGKELAFFLESFPGMTVLTLIAIKSSDRYSFS